MHLDVNSLIVDRGALKTCVAQAAKDGICLGANMALYLM